MPAGVHHALTSRPPEASVYRVTVRRVRATRAWIARRTSCGGMPGRPGHSISTPRHPPPIRTRGVARNTSQPITTGRAGSGWCSQPCASRRSSSGRLRVRASSRSSGQAVARRLVFCTFVRGWRFRRGRSAQVRVHGVETQRLVSLSARLDPQRNGATPEGAAPRYHTWTKDQPRIRIRPSWATDATSTPSRV